MDKVRLEQRIFDRKIVNAVKQELAESKGVRFE